MAHGRLSVLRPEHCSATVNVVCGMLAEWLDCSVDEVFRVLQQSPQRSLGTSITCATNTSGKVT
jgi:hypothetical protein